MKNILFGNSLIDASPELVPRVAISPFHHIRSFQGPISDDMELCVRTYFSERFHRYYIFPKARDSIREALSAVHLLPDDVVTIFTTSGNYYISSCVTREIEKICKWSRAIEEKTKVLFINHEFGYPMGDDDYARVAQIKQEKKNLLVIEDCAHTFFSKSENIGKMADFVIYSLPKCFSMQIGSVLSVSEERAKIWRPTANVGKEYLDYVTYHMAEYIPKITSYVDQQLKNYRYLADSLCHLGIQPFFEQYQIGPEHCVPSVFLFQWTDTIDYPGLKEFMQRNGVESSVFYGENAFYIPCNYNLSRDELDYMVDLLEYYHQNNEH